MTPKQTRRNHNYLKVRYNIGNVAKTASEAVCFFFESINTLDNQRVKYLQSKSSESSD